MSQFLKRVLCLACLCMLLTGALASGVDARVGADARFYQSASGDSPSVRIKKGAQVSVTGASGAWAFVTWKGVEGCMRVRDLNTADRAPARASHDTFVYAAADTASERRAVPEGTAVYVVAQIGDFLWVENAGGTAAGYMPAGDVALQETGRKQDDAWKAKVVKLNWYADGDDAFAIGDYGYIYDIETGLTVHVKRTGGVNHADCEPAGRSDTAKLKKIAGGEFRWDSHPVILYADGRFIACAISTMPQGEAAITNNGYDGQFCLHMLGSKTHDPEAVNDTHQKNVNRAYNWAHS